MAWLLALQWALSVRVEGATSCPLPFAVEARLAELLPGGETPTAVPDVVELVAEETALVLYLRTADGAPAGVRRLPRDHACDDLAAAAAVAIASWQSDVHPAFAAAPSPPPLAAPPPVAAAETPLAVAPAGLSLVVAAGGLSSVSTGGVAPTFAGSATWEPARWPFGLRLGGFAQGMRTQALGEGQAAWQRLGAGVGLEGQRVFGAGLWHVSAALSVLAGWLTVEGRGFTENRRERSWEPGAEAATGLGRSLGRGLRILGGLALSAWPRAHEIEGPTGQTGALPHIDVLLSVGLGWQNPQ